ncbi:MAG TPA: hypothetical protein VK403_06855 [Allosphingosinicella sp.]|nr:hypothetical protein [Allosphingosinicella sp.]
MRSRKRIAMLLAGTALAAAAVPGQAAETIVYGYDSLGRLIRVDHIGNVNERVAADYSYDAADNRTSVAVSAAGTGSPPPPAPSLPAGGFEAPDVGTGFLYNPDASFTGNSGLAGNGSAWGFPAAPEGDQVAFIQTGPAAGVISLPAAGLAPGASYTVGFRLAARPGYLGTPVTVALDGTPLGTFTPGSHAFVAVTSAAFTASGGSGTLTFTGIATADDRTSAIDLVTLSPAGAPPPPAPSVPGGGFETPDVGSGHLYNPNGGFTGNSGLAGNGSAWGFPAAPEGDQVAFIQNGPTAGTVSLPVTGLTPGTSYSAGFRLTARPGYLGTPVTVAFDGTPLGTFTPGSYAFVALSSAAFTASASTGTLTFTGLATAENMASAIDMVSVAAAGNHP